MSVEHAALPATQAKIAARGQALAIALLLVALAAWPRLTDLGMLVTVDEVNFWYHRTNAYDQALRTGTFADTHQSGHPGATTMLLGTIGLRLPFEVDADAPSAFLARLARARFPLALVGAIAVGLGYLLLRHLFSPPLALLAAGLWAADLVLIGYSRLLHLDALLASFMTLSLLGLLAALAHSQAVGSRSRSASTNLPRVAAQNAATVAGPARPQSRQHPSVRALELLAAICAGLALLTKSPAVLLLPLSGLAFVMLAPAQGAALSSRLRFAAPRWLAFLLSAAATMLLCWPAMWVAPLQALASMVAEVTSDGLDPHASGNFFMGRYTDDPGPAFYPLVLLYRLSPPTLLGLALLPLAARRHFPGLLAPRRSLLLLGLFALGFALMLSVSAKKFDRYLLPAFPALDILAAVGWMGLLASPFSKRRAQLGVAALLALSVALVARYQPYSMSYFNPLLGGGQAAQRIFLVGWGEGLEQASAFLNQEPDARNRTVSSSSVAVLRASAIFSVVDVGGSLDPIPRDYPNYLVLYSSYVQRGIGDPGARYLYEQATPLRVVRIHGVEYAHVYQIPPSVPTPLPADFGPAVHLRGYSAAPLAGVRGLRAALFWEARGATAADVLAFVHLLGPDGQRYAQIDLPPGGAEFPSSAWTPGRFLITAVELPLPAQAPPGRYQLVVGLYDPASATRLPLGGTDSRADPAVAGPEALLLTSVALP
jgi:4-amino-4-deoxy-L-arabinose transferase-like glycosyltransferase